MFTQSLHYAVSTSTVFIYAVLMVKVVEFHRSWVVFITAPLTWISCITVFSRYQNERNAGNRKTLPEINQILIKLKYLPYSQIILRSNVLHHHFYLPDIDIKVQNGQGVLGSLVWLILDMGLACWGSMAILDLNIYFR